MNTFMSLEQAFQLLDKEVQQGLYKIPEMAKLTEKEIQLLKAGRPIKTAITQKELTQLTILNNKKQKYRGRCYQLPVKIIIKKLKMVCYLQNLRK